MNKHERAVELLEALFRAGYGCGYYDGKHGLHGLTHATWVNEGGVLWDESVRAELIAILDAKDDPDA